MLDSTIYPFRKCICVCCIMKFLFDNFDILAKSPEGIKKTREKILQFAVQGKLVSQDLHDEPASILLEKIRVEKEHLVNERKILKKVFLELLRY